MKHQRRAYGPQGPERQRRKRIRAAFRRRPVPPPDPPPSQRFGDHGGEDLPLGIGTAVSMPDTRGRWIPAEDAESEPARTTPASPENIQDRIRLLEARLDGMLADVPQSVSEVAARVVPDSSPAPGDESQRTEQQADFVEAAPETTVGDDAQRFPFFQRTWGRGGRRQRAGHVDDFGLDPDYERRYAHPLFDFLFRFYFRVQVEGIEHVPPRGRCLIVANHSGTLPLDGAMLRTTIRRRHPERRDLRWLAEDYLYYLPFVGTYITRIGAVRGCPENAERLLAREGCVAAFPEGMLGIGKLYRERYQLQRFGRGGFMRLALRSGAPIVPCAIIGAEETAPLLFREEAFARWLGFPYLPVTPTFPWLGPMGLWPAPSRWKILFGEPFQLAEYGPGAADDDVLVVRLAEHVRRQVQQMVDSALAKRRSVWFG